MPLPKWATTVTPLSKTLALIIFITFPIVGFFLGVRYQQIVDLSQNNPLVISSTHSGDKGCTLEAKICPDGTTVGRIGPKCEFAPCPTAINQIFCGGLAGKTCPAGYVCRYDSNNPNAGGTCIKK